MMTDPSKDIWNRGNIEKSSKEALDLVQDSHHEEIIASNTNLYGIHRWGGGYFHINQNGNVALRWSVDLYHLTQDMLERGLRLPLMIRFSDILRERIRLISTCFSTAFQDNGYQGGYFGVYPIKVNQQRHLVEELMRHGRPHKLGLECGSKPELLVVLALMNNPDALVICNGFKDQEYIETAILSQKLGKHTIIVVDRFDEIPLIIGAARKLNTKPHIGLRVKLSSQGAGKWAESSGSRSKFGLTTPEIIEGLELLRQSDLLESVELLHFHIGSQISEIQSIKTSLKEGARFFTEVYRSGATQLRFIDVGGGLGIDYDGTGVTDHSINYSAQEYANDVVSSLQAACDAEGVPHPNIVTESGRFLVAHHSVLIFDILGSNDLKNYTLPQVPQEHLHPVMNDLLYILEKLEQEDLTQENQNTPDLINESYNNLLLARQEMLQLFTYGVLNLQQRAWSEGLYFYIATKLMEIMKGMNPPVREDIVSNLSQELCSTYYCNFSIFQSLPDAWAIDQIFPVMPIHRLNEEPTQQSSLADLTCDSDGKLASFIDTETGGTKETLPVHPIQPGKPYLMGVFLTGAYQETLGDLHNLFGDTDAVHISFKESGEITSDPSREGNPPPYDGVCGEKYTVDHYIPGDTVNEVLTYVQYLNHGLTESIRTATEEGIQKGSLTKQEAKLLIKHYEEGLGGYTYLEE